MPEDEIATDLSRIWADAFASATAQVRSVADNFAKELLTLRPGLLEVQRRLDYWEANAPKLLREEVGAYGLIVPLSRMSFPDLDELTGLHEQGGGPAVVQRIREHYDEIFGGKGFLDGLDQAWAADAHLVRRSPLLRQALEAHREGRYALSIPVLLAQFEGLVADAARPDGRFPHAEMRAYVERITAEHPVVGVALSSYVKYVLHKKFLHGRVMPPFSRHAVLHGGDVDYATESNGRTAILAIEEIRDYLPNAASPSPGC